MLTPTEFIAIAKTRPHEVKRIKEVHPKDYPEVLRLAAGALDPKEQVSIAKIALGKKQHPSEELVDAIRGQGLEAIDFAFWGAVDVAQLLGLDLRGFELAKKAKEIMPSTRRAAAKGLGARKDGLKILEFLLDDDNEITSDLDDDDSIQAAVAQALGGRKDGLDMLEWLSEQSAVKVVEAVGKACLRRKDGMPVLIEHVALWDHEALYDDVLEALDKRLDGEEVLLAMQGSGFKAAKEYAGWIQEQLLWYANMRLTPGAVVKVNKDGAKEDGATGEVLTVDSKNGWIGLRLERTEPPFQGTYTVKELVPVGVAK